MIFDELTEFADANTAGLQGATGTELLGDVVDLSTARNIGTGRPLYLVVTVDTAVDSAADGSSVEFVLASDASATIATDGTASEHASSGVIAEANLTAGKVIVVPIGHGVDFERFIGVLVKRTGEAVTAGAVNAFLTMDDRYLNSYPDSANIGTV